MLTWTATGWYSHLPRYRLYKPSCLEKHRDHESHSFHLQYSLRCLFSQNKLFCICHITFQSQLVGGPCLGHESSHLTDCFNHPCLIWDAQAITCCNVRQIRVPMKKMTLLKHTSSSFETPCRQTLNIMILSFCLGGVNAVLYLSSMLCAFIGKHPNVLKSDC